MFWAPAVDDGCHLGSHFRPRRHLRHRHFNARVELRMVLIFLLLSQSQWSLSRSSSSPPLTLGYFAGASRPVHVLAGKPADKPLCKVCSSGQHRGLVFDLLLLPDSLRVFLIEDR